MMTTRTVLGACLVTLAHAALPPAPVSALICDENAVGAITCSSSVEGGLLEGQVSLLDGPYTCGEPFSQLVQAGPEDIYSFTCQQDGDVTFAIGGLDCDLDVYVLEACDTDIGCVVGSTAASTTDDSVTFPCVAGVSYEVVIEGFGFQILGPGRCLTEARYQLEALVGGGCAEDCDNGLDDDFDGRIDCDDLDCLGDPVCDPPVPPDGFIDITSETINVGKGGVIPVVIFGADEFDPTSVDVATLAFGPAGASPVHAGGHLEDVDVDGRIDLVTHYLASESGIELGQTQACLTGELLDGTPIGGCDAIRTVSSER